MPAQPIERVELDQLSNAALPYRWNDFPGERERLQYLKHSPEHLAFMRAIEEEPEENTGRLAWADWLQEQDCPSRAALVRAQCDPYSFPLDNASIKTLCAAFKAELPEPIDFKELGLCEFKFERGLPEAFIGETPALAIAIQALNNHRTRHIASYALGRIGSHEAVSKLLELLSGDTDKNWFDLAYLSFSSRDPRVLPTVIKCLSDPDWNIRSQAADVLCGVKDERAKTALLLALKDTHSKVLVNVFRALVDVNYYPITSQADFLAISTHADHPSSSIRYRVMRLLGRAKNCDVVPILEHALEDPCSVVRKVALEALGKQGAIESAPRIARHLNAENEEERRAADYALRTLKELSPRELDRWF